MTRAVVINLPTPVFWGFIGKDEKKRAADLSLHISLTPLSQLGNTGLLPFLGEKNKLKPKGEDTGLGSQSPRSMGLAQERPLGLCGRNSALEHVLGL